VVRSQLRPHRQLPPTPPAEANPAIGRGRAAALPNASRDIRRLRGKESGAVGEAAREGGGGGAEGKRRRGGGFGVEGERRAASARPIEVEELGELG
jgi:hypothetical protein